MEAILLAEFAAGGGQKVASNYITSAVDTIPQGAQDPCGAKPLLTGL